MLEETTGLVHGFSMPQFVFERLEIIGCISSSSVHTSCSCPQKDMVDQG